HRLFVESRWTGADLRSLVTQELSPYSREGDGQARIEGPQLMVEPDAAQAIAVTLHELATNAAKYGALSVPEGYVQVEWSRTADARTVVRGTEANAPAVTPPTHPRLRHARDGKDDHQSPGGPDSLRVARARACVRNHRVAVTAD